MKENGPCLNPKNDAFIVARVDDIQAMEGRNKPRMIRQAVEHLRFARLLLRKAGADKPADRIKAVLASADGARRHAESAAFRPRSRGKYAARTENSSAERDPDT